MEQTNSAGSIRNWLNLEFPTRNSIARDAGISVMQAYKIGHGMSQPKDETIEKFRSAAVRRRDDLLKELLVIQSVIEK
jgi:hypothetical protein